MKCPKCNFSGTDEEVISHHTRLHVRGIEERFRCSDCRSGGSGSNNKFSYTFDSPRGYIMHRRNEHGEKYIETPKEIREKNKESYSDGVKEYNCSQCSEIFKRHPSATGGETPKFCSYSCYNKSKVVERVKLTCPACGDTFERLPSKMNDGKNFCSRECGSAGKYNANYIDGNGSRGRDYGSSWPKRRKRAKERDFYHCRVCRISESECRDKYGCGLQVHHRTPFRLFENKVKANRLRNLLTVCPKCHGNLEKELRDYNS